MPEELRICTGRQVGKPIETLEFQKGFNYLIICQEERAHTNNRQLHNSHIMHE